MRYITTLTAALLFAGASHAQEVVGSYAVKGTNPDGSTYTGMAEITPLSDVTCEVVWTTDGTDSTGICMRYENAFAAAYTLNDDIGLLIYEIMPDGTMQGTWTIAGSDGVGTEVLIPQ